jgi:hypothetical protein
MALHATPEEHDADPPSGWTVQKHGRKWRLRNKSGGTLATVDTKREAESLKSSGWLFDLYHDEGRWFNGEQVRNWKPYCAA